MRRPACRPGRRALKRMRRDNGYKRNTGRPGRGDGKPEGRSGSDGSPEG